MTRGRANLLLLLAAALWGGGNVCQKTVLEHLDPTAAVALRCLVAALVVVPLAAMERRGPATGWTASLVRVTLCFAAAMTIQQAAYRDASVTNASFLINTATVMTPLAAWLLLRERPGAPLLLAALLTLAGAFLMSGGRGGIGPGDRAVLLSAAFYALWTVELGRHVQAHGRPVTTAAVQFAATAGLLLPVAAVRGDMDWTAIRAAAPDLVVLGVLATGVAFALQAAAQCHTSASHAAVLVSAESIFGATAAALVLGERLALPAGIGAALIVAAILFVARLQPAPRPRHVPDPTLEPPSVPTCEGPAGLPAGPDASSRMIRPIRP